MTLFLTDSLNDIKQAAHIIQQGGTVAFGTETVYGLGADATQDDAIRKIYAAKGRPSHNPLISHFTDLDHVFEFAEKTELAYQLAEKFWPGPLTLVLKKKHNRISPLATANLPTMAVRVPATQLARQLIAYSQTPIAAPSANRSGKISPSTAQHVLQDLNNQIDAILDSGPCQVGVESTILDLSQDQPVLLRPGGITVEALRQVCGIITFKAPTEKLPSERAEIAEKLIAPGQLSSHYAPSLPVRLNCQTVTPDEALLAFGEKPPVASLSINLSPTGNLEEAAQNLFAHLHFLDQEGQKMGLTGIAVMPIPDHGLGQAIQDRLQRAAAPRPLK